MKNIIKTLAIFTLFSSMAFGSFFDQYEVAVGFNIGTDKGLNLLIHDGQGYGYQSNLSVDFNDSDNVIDFSIDKLFFMDLGANIPVYTGIGIKVSDKSKKYFGVRAVAGISYFVTQLDDDLEIFGELTPTIYLTDLESLFDLEFGLGMRYYF